MTKKAVVLVSGGQDSTTCLAWAINKFGLMNVYPVSFWYNQRHSIELSCATEILRHFKLDQRHYVLSAEALSNLSSAALTNPDIAVEEVSSSQSGNVFAHEHGLPSTFVPGRNMLFLTLAAAYGARYGAYDLVCGVCEADRAGYPDCRAEFVAAAQDALSEALDEIITIHAPLLTLDKGKTFQLADNLGVLEIILEMTHTCYEGDRRVRHAWGYGCGQCPACNERRSGWESYLEGINAPA